MKSTEQQAVETLSAAQKGELAFGFIQETANKLATNQDYRDALVRGSFDPNVLTTPRHYGTTIYKGRYIYNISPFAGHEPVRKPAGYMSLKIRKYDAGISRKETDPSKALIGGINASAGWTEVDGVKIFNHGGACYDDQVTGFPGIEDTEEALKRGRILIADLFNPINF